MLRRLYQWFSPGARAEHASCSCGWALPLMRLLVVTFNTGNQERYCLGQCGRCRTVYWDGPAGQD
jgi:hypothetical protein